MSAFLVPQAAAISKGIYLKLFSPKLLSKPNNEVCLSIHRSLTIHLFVHLTVYPIIHPSVKPFVHPFIYPCLFGQRPQ